MKSSQIWSDKFQVMSERYLYGII